jgi:glutamate-1-semialdehyde aminotransferase
MANGYEIGAVVGRADILDVLKQEAFLSSTFFSNSLAQVAALATIAMLERDRVLDVVRARGERFGELVGKICVESDVPCTFTGAPWMPFVTFDPDDRGMYRRLRNTFYTELIRRGVFLQPYHHGYIAYRHSEEDLAFAADMIAEALAETKKLVLE